MTCHVFAETTDVVAAPPNFASVVLPPTWLYILGFIEIRSGVSESQRVEYLAIVQAVIIVLLNVYSPQI